MSAILAALGLAGGAGGGLVGVVIGAVANFLNDWLSAIRRDGALRDLGRQEQERADAEGSARSQEAYATLAVQPRDRDGTARRMRDGTF